MDPSCSFSACQLCQTTGCCTRLGTESLIGRGAFLTPKEKARIASSTGRPTADFSVTVADGEHILNYILAKADGRCTFLNDAKQCTIYDQRPMDCRFYPFDVAKIDGRLTWIVHLRYCQWGASQWEGQVGAIEERFMAEILPHLEAYASVVPPRWVDGIESWRPLRPRQHGREAGQTGLRRLTAERVLNDPTFFHDHR